MDVLEQGKVFQYIKVLASNAVDWSLIAKTHLVNGKLTVKSCPLASTPAQWHVHTSTHASTHKIDQFNKKSLCSYKNNLKLKIAEKKGKERKENEGKGRERRKNKREKEEMLSSQHRISRWSEWRFSPCSGV